MKKYRIAQYQISTSFWFVNGGKLIVTENEYVIKCFFKTVAKFEINKTIASKIPSILFHQGLRLTDGVKSIDLYFFVKTANELYKLFDL